MRRYLFFNEYRRNGLKIMMRKKTNDRNYCPNG